MLIKEFITNDELAQLIEWGQSIPNGDEPNFVFLELLANKPSCSDEIKAKCSLLLNNTEHFLSVIDDFFLTVPVDVAINNHVDGMANCTKDGVEGEFKNNRFVILLQKPTTGGELIVDGNIVTMEEKDCFILNTALEHELTKVEGNKRYISIVFIFESK